MRSGFHISALMFFTLLWVSQAVAGRGGSVNSRIQNYIQTVEPEEPPVEVMVEEDPIMAEEPAVETGPPQATLEDLELVQKASNTIALKSLEKLLSLDTDPNTNPMIPAHVYMGTILHILAGAEGVTETEILKAMGFYSNVMNGPERGKIKDKLIRGFREITERAKDDNYHYVSAIAYGERAMIRKTFVDNITFNLNALELKIQPGVIDDLSTLNSNLSSSGVSQVIDVLPDVGMALAVAFSSSSGWKAKFEEGTPAPRDVASEAPIPKMKLKNPKDFMAANVSNSDGEFGMASIKTAGNLYFDVILPNARKNETDNQTLERTVRMLSNKEYSTFINKLSASHSHADFSMPQLQIEYRGTKMNEVLKAFVPSLFAPGAVLAVIFAKPGIRANNFVIESSMVATPQSIKALGKVSAYFIKESSQEGVGYGARSDRSFIYVVRTADGMIRWAGVVR